MPVLFNLIFNEAWVVNVVFHPVSEGANEFSKFSKFFNLGHTVNVMSVIGMWWFIGIEIERRTFLSGYYTLAIILPCIILT